MAPISPQFPIPLPPWAKWGLRALPLVWGAAEALLDHAGTVATGGDLQWRRAVLVYERGVALGQPEDEAVVTWDLVNITGSQVDPSWTAGDYANVITAFTPWLTTIATHTSTSYVFKEMRFYRMQFATPMTPERRFVPSGPPENIAPIGGVGAAVGDPLPSQVAFSVTERTAIPRHWGRFYLPGFNESTQGGGLGRWNTSVVDSVGAATESLYNSLALLELFPVVVSTQADKVLAGSLIGVSNIQCDNVPDVIRRRRLDVSTHTFVSS